MSNALSILDKKANLPAHLREAVENDHAWDSVGGTSIPRIEVSDRRIKALLNGTEVASTKNPITVVLVKPGAVGRTFYKSEYQKGEKAKPDCYSIDGIKPAADAQTPQSNKCDTCEMNIKGSSKTMANAKACRYRQPVAVWIPGDKTWGTLFRVSLPATAIFPDEENSEGFRPLNKYVKELRAAGANPSMVWTEMAIDDDQDQPRLLFKVTGWIDTEEDFAQVRMLAESKEVDDILNTMPQDDDTATNSTASNLGDRPSHIDSDGVDARRTRREAAQPKDYPTEWPKGLEESEFVDDKMTYWFHETSDTYFAVPADQNLPVEGAGLEELTEEAFAADLAQQQRELEEAREKAEAARRKAEEDARVKAEAEAAAAAASTTRRRRGSAPAEEAETAAPAGRGRRTAAPAAEPEPETPAPRGRRAATPAAEPEPEPETPAPRGRRTAAPAGDAEPASGPVSRRRTAAPAGRTAAPAEPEDEGVKPPARRAAAAADEAPHTVGGSNNLAALEDIILAENDDD